MGPIEGAFYIFYLYIFGKYYAMQTPEAKKSYEGSVTTTPSLV